MRNTIVHRHYRYGGKVPVVQHNRQLEERPEREKFEKPKWAKEKIEYGGLYTTRHKLLGEKKENEDTITRKHFGSIIKNQRTNKYEATKSDFKNHKYINKEFDNFKEAKEFIEN